VHQGVENRAAEAKIDAEHHAPLADDADDLGEIGERPQRFETDHHRLAPAASTSKVLGVCAGIHHDGAGEAGLELRQLRSMARCTARPGWRPGRRQWSSRRGAPERLEQDDGIAHGAGTSADDTGS
jgi:hypothetical protein